MRDLKGKVAFITGGASGIGLAIARAFGRQGMAVVIADIEADPLAAAVEELRSLQVSAEGMVVDVAARGEVREAAKRTIERFGRVDVVCNNAGVAAGGPIGSVAERDWDWVIDVNLKGVVYGVETFTPLIESHGQGGHFVNTASIAGMLSPANMEPYSATKFAVVAMSEGWATQLAAKNIGVSILCPGFVKTRIHESRRNRPESYGPDQRVPPAADAAPSLVLTGIAPDPVGERVVEAVKANELYVFTHPEFRANISARFQRILAGFDAAERSAVLAKLERREAPALALAPTARP